MSLAAWLGTVVAYGTTGRAARRFGAGDRAAAVAEGVQASWLALAAGLLIAARHRSSAPARSPVPSPATAAEVADAAAQWLRIAALGAPGLLLAAAGNGWLRGVQDTRRPLSSCSAPTLLSALALPAAGLPGRAGPARLGGRQRRRADARRGCSSLRALVASGCRCDRSPASSASSSVLSRDLLIRGLAFQACFLSATAVAARFGAAARRRPPDRAATLVLHRAARSTPSPSPRSRWSAPRSAPATRPAPGRSARRVGAARRRLRASAFARADRRRRRRRPALFSADRGARSRRTSPGRGSSACSRWPGWCSPSTAC